MTYRIKVSERGWSCAPRGGSEVSFKPGIYKVPDEMSEYLAGRCIASGRGARLMDVKEGAPSNKKLKGAPENKSAA